MILRHGQQERLPAGYLPAFQDLIDSGPRILRQSHARQKRLRLATACCQAQDASGRAQDIRWNAQGFPWCPGAAILEQEHGSIKPGVVHW
jgi:hypothetical protein